MMLDTLVPEHAERVQHRLFRTKKSRHGEFRNGFRVHWPIKAALIALVSLPDFTV